MGHCSSMENLLKNNDETVSHAETFSRFLDQSSSIYLSAQVDIDSKIF